jgi:hypothetical protein
MVETMQALEDKRREKPAVDYLLRIQGQLI